MKEMIPNVRPLSAIILKDDHVSIENQWKLDQSSIPLDLEEGLELAFQSDAHQILTLHFLPALTVKTLPYDPSFSFPRN
jgi:hypothetical protein